MIINLAAAARVVPITALMLGAWVSFERKQRSMSAPQGGGTVGGRSSTPAPAVANAGAQRSTSIVGGQESNDQRLRGDEA
jgi:hypothetical protein